MMIVGENFCEALAGHHIHGEAISQAIGFVEAGSV
jgi:hypothetical protein